MRRSLAIALVLAFAVPASAREPTVDDFLDTFYPPDAAASSASASSSRVSSWYGWEILLLDGALIGTFASYPAWPGFSGDGIFPVLAGSFFPFAGAAVHEAHDDAAATGVSIGIRFGAVSGAALIGYTIRASMPCSCASELFCVCGLSNGVWGMFDGALVGAGVASILDAFLLAHGGRVSKSGSSVSWTVAPIALPRGGGLGVAGAF